MLNMSRNMLLRRLLYTTRFINKQRLCSTLNGSEINGEIIKQATDEEGKEIKVTTSSLRIDTVAAVGLTISRRKLWELSLTELGHTGFGSILLNGKPVKKSKQVNKGDIIEIDTDSERTNVTKRGRVIVKDIGERTKNGGYHLILLRWKQYLVYKRHVID